MHPLLAILASWPGPEATRLVLEQKGYQLPVRFRELVFQHCSACDPAKVERYWMEVALEYWCAAGRVNSLRRQFVGETSYRSSYLDLLASDPENQEAALRGLPLDPGVRSFRSKIYETTVPGLKLGEYIEQKMQEYKKPEIAAFGFIGKDDQDFETILRSSAQSRGFSVRGRTARKLFGGALELMLTVDSGRKSTSSFNIPLHVELVHRSAPDLKFISPTADRLMPSFHYYALYRSPDSAMLGVQAYVDLFDTIGQLTAY